MPQGHPDYRFIAQEMSRKIQEVHPEFADVGKFIDWKSCRLGRLSRSGSSSRSGSHLYFLHSAARTHSDVLISRQRQSIQ